jgi:zinc protease
MHSLIARRAGLLAATLAWAVAVGPRVHADVTPPTLKIASHTLENGLQVVLAPDTSRPVVNVQVWYRVGSKDEREGRTGFAHLFEHMMFRGSANVGPEEHMRLVREAGGVVNAYTSFDRTVYWQTVPSNHLERVLWLEADRMQTLVVNEENFQKEREVVKEERRLRYENPPYGMLAEWVLDATFEVYPYKRSPIGSMEDLNAATVDGREAVLRHLLRPRQRHARHRRRLRPEDRAGARAHALRAHPPQPHAGAGGDGEGAAADRAP